MSGRPKHKPTEEHRHQVKIMAAFGIQQSEIANLIECDAKTLRKHYRRELDTGATEANLRVAQSLYNLATKDRNVAACIWWTKARMGWREAQDLNIGGNSALHVDFRWADAAAAAPPSPQPAREAPTIDAETTDAGEGGDLVVWAAE